MASCGSSTFYPLLLTYLIYHCLENFRDLIPAKLVGSVDSTEFRCYMLVIMQDVSAKSTSHKRSYYV